VVSIFSSRFTAVANSISCVSAKADERTKGWVHDPVCEGAQQLCKINPQHGYSRSDAREIDRRRARERASAVHFLPPLNARRRTAVEQDENKCPTRSSKDAPCKLAKSDAVSARALRLCNYRRSFGALELFFQQKKNWLSLSTVCPLKMFL
jgi:hypothetical protein